MTATTRSTPTSRGGVARRSAVLAIAVLFAGCNDRDSDDAVPAQRTPPPPSSPSVEDRADADNDRDREQGRLAPSKPAPEPSDAERRAQREPTPPSGMHDPTRMPDGQMHRSELSGPQAEQQMQIVEKSASGDIRGFETRLKRELAKEELQLAAAVDLQQQPPMRLLVVAPEMTTKRDEKAAAKRGAAGEEKSARDDATQPQADRAAPTIETPGTPQTPDTVAPATPPGTGAMENGEDGMPSQEARAALEQVRVLVAYSEEGDTDRVRLAYFEHPRATEEPTRGEDMTATVDAAIERAARGPEGAPAG